jgi:hypothetical protein
VHCLWLCGGFFLVSSTMVIWDPSRNRRFRSGRGFFDDTVC